MILLNSHWFYMPKKVSKSEKKIPLQLVTTGRVIRSIEKMKLWEREELLLCDKMLFIADSVDHW